MILFIFEGAKYEPPLYEGLKSLFFLVARIRYYVHFVVVSIPFISV